MKKFSSYQKSRSFPGHFPVISRTLAFDERATVNPQVSLLDLTLEAGIPDDVM